MKSPLLAFIKFEPTFLTGSLAVCLSAPVQGEAGGRGIWGEFRPPAEATFSDWTISSFLWALAHEKNHTWFCSLAANSRNSASCDSMLKICLSSESVDFLQ